MKSKGSSESKSPKSFYPSHSLVKTSINVISPPQPSHDPVEDVSSEKKLMVASTSSPKPLRSKKPSTRHKKGQLKWSPFTYSFSINSH